MRARRTALFVGLVLAVSVVVVPARAGVADPFDHRLRDVAVVAADDAWAVGDDLIVHWDGVAWTVTGPSIMRAHTYAAVAARNAADVWVVGWVVSQDQNVPLLLHYDGVTWTRVHVPRPAGEGMLHDVVVMAGGVVWAVGGFDLYTPDVRRRGGLAYRFDGSSWARIPVPARVATLSAATPSGRAGLWTVGMIENPLSHPAALRWNGRAWRVDRLPEYERNTFATDVVSLGHGRLTVVGSIWFDAASDRLAGVYILRYDAGRWTLERRTPVAALAGVDAGPGGRQVAVGQARPDFRAMAMGSDVSGWHRLTVPAPARASGLLGVDIRTASDAWAVGWLEGTDGWADPMAMHWDGSDWTRVDVPTA
ncbi:MAG: hypothetical protein ACXWYJ_12060 [Actinomycetota bacterium]